MKIDGFQTYKTYLALKLHFEKDDYDYTKYSGEVNTKLETFTKRHDRYFFHKLSTRYNKDDIIKYFVANFSIHGPKWIGNILNNEGTEAYNKFRKYQDSWAYNFKSDIVLVNDNRISNNLRLDDVLLCNNGQHPLALRLLLSKKISLQTILILDTVLSFTKDWNKNIKEKIVWPGIYKKMVKLKPFVQFNSTEAKMICKEVFYND